MERDGGGTRTHARRIRGEPRTGCRAESAMVAQPAGGVDPARVAAHRARRTADRRRDHRAAAVRAQQRADRQRDLAGPPRQRHLRSREGGRLPQLARPHARCRRDRRLRRRAPVRGRGVGGHAYLPRQRVRPRGAPTVRGAHPADQPGTVLGGGEALSRPPLRPQQPVHHQHAVVRREGLAHHRGAPDVVRPAAARSEQPAADVHRQGLCKDPGGRRRPCSRGSRSHGPGPVQVSSCAGRR